MASCFRVAARAVVAVLCVLSSCLLATVGASGEEEALEVIRVEEDWRLVVSSPDAESAAPQVTTAISPTSNDDGLHATFELNHQSLPSFEAGGLSLQIWEAEDNVATHRHVAGEMLSTDSEEVTWTMCMYQNGGRITFDIASGHSQTWGRFGHEGALKSSIHTALPNLNGYSPDYSVQSSGVGFAGNRVQSLVLVRVRYSLSNGQTLVDDEPRSVIE